MQRRICKLKIDEKPGTGFLVAPTVVLTNYHLVKDLLRENRTGDGITVWFDFVPGQGREPDTGERHALDDDWCIGYARDSEVDAHPERLGVVPSDDELDYALLRLRDAPGDVNARGFIPVPDGDLVIAPRSSLCILQYASRRPLEVAFSPAGAVALRGRSVRLRHIVNTADASSGSPVFDKDWKLIALHRGYVIPPSPHDKFELNDAIPIAKIRRHFLQNASRSTRGLVNWR
jgi:hypothetical protein